MTGGMWPSSSFSFSSRGTCLGLGFHNGWLPLERKRGLRGGKIMLVVFGDVIVHDV